jgi:hypothetical protein
MSLFVCFTLTPWLASRFAKETKLNPKNPFQAFLIWFEKRVSIFTDQYVNLVEQTNNKISEAHQRDKYGNPNISSAIIKKYTDYLAKKRPMWYDPNKQQPSKELSEWNDNQPRNQVLLAFQQDSTEDSILAPKLIEWIATGDVTLESIDGFQNLWKNQLKSFIRSTDPSDIAKVWASFKTPDDFLKYMKNN